MPNQIPAIRRSLPTTVNDHTHRVLAALDLLYRASYAEFPVSVIELPITESGLLTLENELEFQVRWSLNITKELVALTNSERAKVGEIVAPFTSDSVTEYMGRIQGVKLERSKFNSLTWRSELPSKLALQKQYRQEIDDLTKAIVCGEEDFQHRMRYIPTGISWMGAEDNDEVAFDVERPRHRVAITAPFWMGAGPVTQRLYKAVMKNNPSEHDIPDCPVDHVRWTDALVFCNRLSRLESLTPCYPMTKVVERDLCSVTSYSSPVLQSVLKQLPDPKANGYRLPTEAEWEYAARANQETLYSGGDALSEIAWYHDNSARQSHPICQKNPNQFGLFDMTGNVWEWCWDSWDGQSYSKDPKILHHNSFCKGQGFKRTTRGGSWYDSPQSVRITHRIAGDLLYPDSGQGFRVVRTVCG